MKIIRWLLRQLFQNQPVEPSPDIRCRKCTALVTTYVELKLCNYCASKLRAFIYVNREE